MTVLLLTTDPPPSSQVPSTGAGLRAWSLSKGLESKGIKTKLAFAADALRGVSKKSDSSKEFETFERSQLHQFINSQNPTAVIFQHWGLLKELQGKVEVPVAIDLAGPHLLERYFWGDSNREKNHAEKITALSRADYVFCSGQYQRPYFLPYLLQAGFPHDATDCPVVRFSLSPQMPEGSDERDNRNIFFGGNLLPWLNPEPVLRKTLDVLDEFKGEAKLTFVGGLHPSGDVSGGKFQNLLEELSKKEFVIRKDAMPYDELLKVMSECGVCLNLQPQNLERELAFPIRTVVALWAGLPVIHNNYDEQSVLIENYKAGWCLDPDDLDNYGKTLERILRRPSDTVSKRRSASRLIENELNWETEIEKILPWIENPKFRENKATAYVAAVSPTTSEDSGSKDAHFQKRQEIKTKFGKIEFDKRAGQEQSRKPVGNWISRIIPVLIFIILLPLTIFLIVIFGIIELIRLLFFRKPTNA